MDVNSCRLRRKRLIVRRKLALMVAMFVLCCAQNLFAQSFLFSARLEGVGISGAFVDNDSTTSLRGVSGKPVEQFLAVGGWTIEAGLSYLYQPRMFYSVTLHGGIGEAENIGAFFNLGGMITDNAAAGFSLGLHRVPYHINVVDNGVRVDRYTDYNYMIGGVFLKLLFGKAHNVDVTSKATIGFRDSHFVIKDGNMWRYYYDDNYSDPHRGAIVAFSLSVGYTLTVKRR